MKMATKSELRGPRRPRADTRASLIRAAEKLFAARGVDAVSLREVSAAAGQANNSAVAYHFGSREGLVDAILERHSTPIQARYAAQSELLERQGSSSLRTLVEVLVLPIVAKLDDPDGGWEYLSLAAQLSVNPRLPLAERPVAQTPAVLRLMGLLAPFTRTRPELMLFRFDRMANTIYASIVSWHRLSREGFVGVSRLAFEQDLVDSLVDILQRASSPETCAALAAPPAARNQASGAKAARPPAVKAARRTAKASRAKSAPRRSQGDR
ncbi:MAG: helix-turn-helix transcriptional regulator [Labilithrix sp.]|nr:helix-turn-helix transcriptional regulator [Labilithrix sp.]